MKISVYILANFVHHSLLLWLFAGYLIFLYTPLFINDKIFLFIDFYHRLQLSDSWFNILYPIWTNFMYLYIILIFLFVTIFSIKVYSHTFNILYKTNLILFVITIFYFFYNIYFLNSTSLYFIFESILFNDLLSNKLNKYHPIILFISLLYSLLLPTSLIKSKFYNSTYLRLIQNSLLLIISITMGSWWAYQEGSWGGWWDWDASEMFSVVILISLLLFSHSSNNHQFSYFYIYKLFIYNVFLVLFYIILQVSLSVVSHNFGITQQGSFLYINYLLFIFSLFLILFNYLLNSFKLIQTTLTLSIMSLNSKFFINTPILIKLISYIICVFILYLTFAITLSDYFQNTAAVITNLLPLDYYNYLILLLFILLVLSLTEFKSGTFILINYIILNLLYVFSLTHHPLVGMLCYLLLINFFLKLTNTKHKNNSMNLNFKLNYHSFIILFISIVIIISFYFTPVKFFNSENLFFNNKTYINLLYMDFSIDSNLVISNYNYLMNSNILSSHTYLTYFSKSMNKNLLNVFTLDNWIQLRLSTTYRMFNLSGLEEPLVFIFTSVTIFFILSYFYSYKRIKLILIKF